MLQPSVCMLQQKSKIPCAITKTWYSQINKKKVLNILKVVQLLCYFFNLKYYFNKIAFS